MIGRLFVGNKAARSTVVAIPALLMLVLLAGCENNYPPDLKYSGRSDPLINEPPNVIDPALLTLDKPGEFDRPGQFSFLLTNVSEDEKRKTIFDPAKLDRAQRKEIESELEALFGTPRHPRADLASAATDEAETREMEECERALQVDEQTLAQGSSLYRVHCLQCHGLTGNGRGPTAPWVNPHPRDYRRGTFKFRSTGSGNERKPRREDLLRTLREGIDGTSMPSFGLLPEDQLHALVSYVIHLSIRGEAEFHVMLEVVRAGTEFEGDIGEDIKHWVRVIAKRWKDADSQLIRPGPYPKDYDASVQRGYQLFRQGAGVGGCIACHLDYGRQSTYMYDTWGTLVRPADLTTGVLRGGRRPIDIYWRIVGGINGAQMPASSVQEPEKLWDLVNFVQVLPYPAMREKYGIKID